MTFLTTCSCIDYKGGSLLRRISFRNCRPWSVQQRSTLLVASKRRTTVVWHPQPQSAQASSQTRDATLDTLQRRHGSSVFICSSEKTQPQPPGGAIRPDLPI